MSSAFVRLLPQEFNGKWKKEVSEWKTKCLNIRFPNCLCLPCCMQDTGWIKKKTLNYKKNYNYIIYYILCTIIVCYYYIIIILAFSMWAAKFITRKVILLIKLSSILSLQRIWHISAFPPTHASFPKMFLSVWDKINTNIRFWEKRF